MVGGGAGGGGGVGGVGGAKRKNESQMQKQESFLLCFDLVDRIT